MISCGRMGNDMVAKKAGDQEIVGTRSVWQR